MTMQIEVLDPSGHLTLEWNPDDPASVAAAQAEWEKLKEAGFAFFADGGAEAADMDAGVRHRGKVEARVVRVEPEAVKPRRGRRGPRRSTAVPPMRGG